MTTALADVFTDHQQSLEDEDRWESYDRVARWIEANHGFYVTGETIRNYHRGTFKKIDPEIVSAIALFYGMRLDDLPADARDAITRARRTLVLIGGGADDSPTAPAARRTRKPSTAPASTRRSPNSRWSIPTRVIALPSRDIEADAA